MRPIYTQEFTVTDLMTDRYCYLKPSAILFFAQEAAGQHCNELGVDYETLAAKHMFWAVVRHRVQITRLPRLGEKIRVETWPMPTTRTAYPRSMVAYDEAGNECFRSICLWVLMNMDTRAIVLPAEGGIEVTGSLRGSELPAPRALALGTPGNHRSRTVCYTDLDRNGHMNNTRYMDWLADLLPSAFHGTHRVREFTVCYYAEGKEGQELQLSWDFLPDGAFQLNAVHSEESGDERVFSARVLFD